MPEPLPALLAICLLCFGDQSVQASQQGEARAARPGSLSGKHRTAHFELRYRPGSRAAASVPRAAAMAERDFADICRRLKFEPKVTFRLFFYDSLEELSQITRTTGNGGFSAGRDSHLPFGNDQTRYHEMVHLVAAQMPSAGDEPRNLFFAEGLANALLEYVHGVHVHAVAAYYLSEKKLPPLSELTQTEDFYGWLRAHPGFNAYDVGASWMRFLLDRFGTRKALRYYHGESAEAALGASEAATEKEWLAMLGGYELMPEVRTLLARRDGEKARFTVVGTLEERLPQNLRSTRDWHDLFGEPPQSLPEHWRWEKKELSGLSSTTDWVAGSVGGERKLPSGAVAMRIKVRVDAGTVGVRIELDPTRQLLLTNAGAFLWSGDTIVAADRAETIVGRPEVDLVLSWADNSMTAWVDGVRVLTAAAKPAKLAPRVAIAGGRAVFESVWVRGLD